MTVTSAKEEVKQLTKDSYLPDPTAEVQEKFLNPLKSSGRITDFQKVASPEEKTEGLLIDLKTIRWGYVHYPMDRLHYRVFYNLRARLIKLPEAKVLWESQCDIKNDDLSDQRITLNALLADHGTLLKSKFSIETSRCAEQLLRAFKSVPEILPTPETFPETLRPAPTPEAPKPEAPPAKQRPATKMNKTCQPTPEGLARLYPIERCEVEALVKRCGTGDPCMIDCYVSRKGEGRPGGCYDLCKVYQKGWTLPPEWAACK